jgi:hypothetical protein
MSNAIVHNPGVPRAAVSVRAATMGDLPFIDRLQKLHTKQVGWMPTKQLVGKIRLGHVLVAEERSEVRDQKSDGANLTSDLCPLTSVPVGYCIGHDQYFKRDDVGIIYQLNVLPAKQRALIGATLLKAQFERSAWGCKLYCCWCAQDIAANRFWEAMGFVPLAFRTGSRNRGQRSEVRGQTGARIHIFWQRRIRAGDDATPWWFPSQTSSGAIREDRLVFPIPPGVSWRDAMPVVLPGEERGQKAEVRDQRSEVRDQKRLAGPGSRKSKLTSEVRPPTSAVGMGFLRFVDPVPPKAGKPKREPRTKARNDPKHVAAARELRDRWLEEINHTPMLGQGKYDVSRALPEPARSTVIVTSAPAELPAPVAA